MVWESDNISDDELRRILTDYRRVAVVGMSRDPVKPANYVPKYLINHGYTIFPVNPNADTILGLKCYKTLSDIREPVDIVNIFRPSEQVLPFAEEALRIHPKVFWMQESIYSPEAA